MRLALAAALLALTSSTSVLAAVRPVAFAAQPESSGSLVIPLSSAGDLDRATGLLDPAARSAVERALAADAFDYKARSTLLIRSAGRWSHVLVVGTGPDPLGAVELQDIGGLAAQELGKTNGPISIAADMVRTAVPAASAEIAIGAGLGGYGFDKYKSADPADTPAPGKNAPITLVTESGQSGQDFGLRGKALVEAVAFSRDLIREPANVLYPESFVEKARSALSGIAGVSVKVLDVAEMERLGMGSILSVGKGSVRPPRMLVMEYRGARGAPLVALAGKGITFDSGGLSLKPGSGMSAMMGDMAGAAAVTATLLSLAKSRAPVNVVAIAALAENMPSGSATRPGDVVRAMNGKTIEILNTDAEGRLVLADAVTYAERTYRPAAIVDIATLTGSVTGALGDEYAGLFSREDWLAAQLQAAGRATGEEVWQLPLHKNYAKDMKSDIADIKNVVEGGSPGASLGAHFIGAFVSSTPWAHLDIANVDSRSESLPTVPKGMSGFGVRLLDRFVRDFRPLPATPAKP